MTTTLKFGRYRNLPLDRVPRAYRIWMLRAGHLTPDLRISVKRSLGMAAAPQPAPAICPQALPDFKMLQAGGD
jgi:hypothetical protein